MVGLYIKCVVALLYGVCLLKCAIGQIPQTEKFDLKKDDSNASERSGKFLWTNLPYSVGAILPRTFPPSDIYYLPSFFPSPLQRSPYYKKNRNRQRGGLTPPCVEKSYKYSTEEDTTSPTYGDSMQHVGFCTSVAACMSANVLGHSFEINSTIVQNIIDLASLSLQPTCLYLSPDNVVEKGVCCKYLPMGDRDDIFSQLSNTTRLRTSEKATSSVGVNEYYGDTKAKPRIIDRGHIFFRPGGPPAEGEKESSSTKSDSEWDDSEYPSQNMYPSHPHMPTHPPLPTHPPDLTNKPWWIRETSSTTPRPPTTARTTTEYLPWWQRPRPTTGQPSKSWSQSQHTTKSWQKWLQRTSTSTTTIKPRIEGDDYCSPSYFRNAQDAAEEDSSKRITGGSPVVPHSYPWIVVLLHGSKHICGGSLITKKHILTAAHCVAKMESWEMSGLRVVLGAHNLYAHETSRQIISIKTVIRHKDYNRALLYNDVAVLTLERPVKITAQVRPICLYSGSDDFANDIATVAGWGSLFEGGAQLHTPRKVNLRIWNNADCRDTYGPAAPGGIVSSYLCAGKRGKDACSGDSGGPIMKQIGGVWQQIGIVSWGIGCGKAHYPGVYSRMTFFLPWIQKVIETY